LRKGFKGRYMSTAYSLEKSDIRIRIFHIFGKNYTFPSNGSSKTYFQITKCKKLLQKILPFFAKSALYNGYNPNPITIYKPL
jgi:hypothetical protein